MTSSPHDHLVEEWLATVARAAADLPPDQVGELLADLREHIDVARADLSPETEDGVRAILERLGDPSMIAAEARGGTPPALPSSAPPGHPPFPDPSQRRSSTKTWVVVALVTVGLLCALSCVVGALGLVSWSSVGVDIEPGSVPIERFSPAPGPTGDGG